MRPHFSSMRLRDKGGSPALVVPSLDPMPAWTPPEPFVMSDLEHWLGQQNPALARAYDSWRNHTADARLDAAILSLQCQIKKAADNLDSVPEFVFEMMRELHAHRISLRTSLLRPIQGSTK